MSFDKKDFDQLSTVVEEINKDKKYFVVMSKDKFDDISVICICEEKANARYIVLKRNEKHADCYCWYQEAEMFSA